MEQQHLLILDYETPNKPVWPSWRAILIGALLMAIPYLAHAAYQPVNEKWTVKVFGCGCPKIRWIGSPPPAFWERFNSNDVNAMLWTLLWGVCSLAWCYLVRRYMGTWSNSVRDYTAFGGAALLAFTCMRYFLHGAWL